VPPPPVLSSISLADGSGHVYAPGETATLRVGAQLGLLVKGRLSNGDDANLQDAAVAIESAKPAVASVDSSGSVNALSAGVAKVTATATLDGVTKDTHVWIDVYDPATLTADLKLTHPTMAVEIGRPAVLAPGGEYPALCVLAPSSRCPSSCSRLAPSTRSGSPVRPRPGGSTSFACD
jgi:Bacterial Ig-like domain (group 2)